MGSSGDSLPRHVLSHSDIEHLSLLIDVNISPSGDHVAFVHKRPDRKADRYRSSICVVEFDTAEINEVTSGRYLDSSPRWSPDGTRLAFTSDRGPAPKEDGSLVRNLFVLDIQRGGDVRQLTFCEDDVSLDLTYPIISESFSWSPDGRLICFSVKDSRAAGEEPPKAYVYDKLRYKSGENGWWDGRRRHLWAIEASGGSPRRLTSGDWDAYGPVFAPNGKTIAFSSNRAFASAHLNTLPDTNPASGKDVWIVPIEGGDPTRLTGADGPNMSPTFSPDGSRIAYFGHRKGVVGWAHNIHVWARSVEGGEPVDLTANWDHTAGSHVMSDIHDVYAPPPVTWTADGWLYFQGTVRGSANLFRVHQDGGPVEAVTTGDHEVQLASVDSRGERFAALIGDDTTPSDLYVGNTRDGALRRFTKVNDELLSSINLSSAEHETIEHDGREIDYWVLKPPGHRNDVKYPLVLEIYPSFVHGRAFNFEYQMLASNGFVVVFANCLGATSYGEAFLAGSYNRGHFFSDEGDQMAVVDALIGTGYVDDTRVGVTGDAYGGTMTLWLLGRTKRFAAAIARRGVTNIWPSSDRTTGVSSRGTDVLADPLPAIQRSPMGHVRDITTPVLLIHSIDDHRGSPSATEELFVALRANDKPARMALFRNGAHFLSRTAPPADRIVFFKIILDWFIEHLGDGTPSVAARSEHSKVMDRWVP